MTDTRKQIIEIIEPYMDKTLSEGCWLKVNREVWETIDIMQMVYGDFPRTKELQQEFGYIMVADKSKIFEYKVRKIKDGDILGHYDITAVLKYMQENNGGYIGESSDLIIINEYNPKTSDWSNIGEMPNKPLHLFNEIEEQQLLELLTKLK